MAGYTKINFMDVEASDNPDDEFRFSRKYLDSKDLGVTLRRMKPNYRGQKAHTHDTQEEVYVVIKGSGRMLLDGKTEDIKQWDVIRVAPETARALEAGPDGLELLIAGGPKPPEGDGRLADASWPQ